MTEPRPASREQSDAVIDLSSLDLPLPLDPDDDPASYIDAQPDRVLGTRPEDFPSFYIRHRTTLTYVARRYMGDARDADEVVQEAFLKIFLAMPELPTELAALSYARRTVVNLCIDRLRASGRRPTLIDLDAVPESRLGLYEDDDYLVEAEDAALVREALAKLSPLHRQALIMREVEERPLAEIAVALAVPEDHVKHLLHRARKALRRLLAGSAVDPSIDIESLTFAELVARRPTRIAVLVLFMVGAVLSGALSSLGGPKPHQTRPLAHDDSALFGRPGLGAAIAPVVPDAAQGAGTSSHAAVALSHMRSSTPPAVSAVTRSAQRTQVRSSTAPQQAAPVVKQPVVAPTFAPAPLVAPIYVTGAGALTGVNVSEESRQQNDSGYASHSVVSAQSASGSLSISQTLQSVMRNGVLNVTAATLNPVIPGSDGSTGYLLATQSVQTTKVAHGIQVVIQGVAIPLSGSEPQGVTVLLTAVYDPSLTSVLSETIRLGLPADPDARTADTSLMQSEDPAQ